MRSRRTDAPGAAALRRGAVALLILAGAPAAGAPGLTEGPPPLPPERPAELAPPAAAPSTPAPPQAEAPPLPPARPPELSGEAGEALKPAPPDDTACRGRLTRLGVAFEPLAPIASGQCSAPLPLKVTGLADGVGLPQSATLTCVAAEALARWATEAQVEADRAFKQPLKAIEIGGSYECRGQNHDTGAKLSEHAFANAVDVMGFQVGRDRIAVKALDPAAPEARFLTAVRGKACAFFRTVLGPGSNAEHANHLHLDERERNAGHRLCE